MSGPGLARGALAAVLLAGCAATRPYTTHTFPCQASRNCTSDGWTGCAIFKSRADGVKDYYYYRLPDGYDPRRTYPLLLWFHAMGQAATAPDPNEDCAISSANLMREVANGSSDRVGGRDMIVLGLAQRGPQSFLGDYCGQACPRPAPDERAAKEDMLELLEQLVARFRINYVVAAGASMGAYSAMRLATLASEKVHVVFAGAPALHRGRGSPTDQGGENGPGSVVVEEAFRRGLFDDKLVVTVVGLADENRDDIIAASRQLDEVMRGKRWWRYAEEEGVPHVNMFTEDYLCEAAGGLRSARSKWPPYCSDESRPNLQNVAYGCRRPRAATCGHADPYTTGRLWDEVRAWERAHPAIAGGELRPRAGWRPPPPEGWYLEPELYARGGKRPPAGPPASAPADAPPAR
ncbi:MAG: hypothetical protein HY906_28050 [Deltaproteobacteria bacterium]|nr:hypothetical protein [Deltaproteobacteria bacterium]